MTKSEYQLLLIKVSWWDRNVKVIKGFGCDLWINVRKLLYQPNESIPRKGLSFCTKERWQSVVVWCAGGHVCEGRLRQCVFTADNETWSLCDAHESRRCRWHSVTVPARAAAACTADELQRRCYSAAVCWSIRSHPGLSVCLSVVSSSPLSLS